MSREDQPQLFDFEIPSSDNFAFIPLSVRFHLDRCGLRISLDDWQRLPLDSRIALSSYRVLEADEVEADGPKEDFAVVLTATMQAHAGHPPETEGGPASLPGDDRTAVPEALLQQCALTHLRVIDLAAWRGLSRFQRYALAKLSRKPKANHDFPQAMREFGLAAALDGESLGEKQDDR